MWLGLEVSTDDGLGRSVWFMVLLLVVLVVLTGVKWWAVAHVPYALCGLSAALVDWTWAPG